MAVAVHPLPAEVQGASPPCQFTYPFCYEPHPLCIAAANEVRRYLAQHPEWHDELQRGKMFGVLVVEGAFLAAFSGTLDGKTQHDYFVPPVFDLMAPGCYFQEEETAISDINRQIEALQSISVGMRSCSSALHQEMQAELAAYKQLMQQHKAERDALRKSFTRPTPSPSLVGRGADSSATDKVTWDGNSSPPYKGGVGGGSGGSGLARQSQHEKAEYRRLKQAWEQRIFEAEAPLRERQQQIVQLQKERHERSIALQQWLFRQFVFLNALGEEKALPELFAPAVPPSGAGECCAPRLLQAAYKEGLQPLCMAEFWVGDSPKDEVRHDGHFYPACNSKCRLILRHMLQGLNVEPNPLLANQEQLLSQLHIIYNNKEMAVVSKPAGMLSVPGKDDQPSVQEAMRQMFPSATGPLIVHRLDMDTSGLMLITLTEEKYHELQNLFLHHRIHKVYHAWLEHEMPVGEEGDISLPLRPDFDDRPRQMVDNEHGKPAQTHYRVLENKDSHALVELRPITGRTHQLRVHCAHSLGLGNPIVGDRLYGKPAERLMLHAYSITIEGKTFTDPNYEL
ncbi:MAG: RNA pseudouridine synthase [Bacteroidaceae bacterium]|nr:RNA pseudouridine synthase [Bacteroidaceae bacterium]